MRTLFGIIQLILAICNIAISAAVAFWIYIPSPRVVAVAAFIGAAFAFMSYAERNLS